MTGAVEMHPGGDLSSKMRDDFRLLHFQSTVFSESVTLTPRMAVGNGVDKLGVGKPLLTHLQPSEPTDNTVCKIRYSST